jgi:hypothetical protein
LGYGRRLPYRLASGGLRRLSCMDSLRKPFVKI